MKKHSYASLSIVAIALACFSFLLSSCTPSPPPVPKDLAKDHLIPVPVSLEATGSSFALSSKTNIYIPENAKQLEQLGQYLADLLNPATGLEIGVKTTTNAPSSDYIYLHLTDQDKELGDEGYTLTTTVDGVSLAANTPAGLFYAVQSLRQLLPAQIESKDKQEGPWLVATGSIRDYPTYAYRGAMLDVSRHFFGVADVKRFIDLISMYKMNVLHLHLADDQGWRLEIKSWPNLTTHGGSTAVGGGEGGFYTQTQYADIVAYAAARSITIIPEIDMPGHTNAALASYAELNCDGKARELYTGTKVGFSTLCTDKEITYKFIDDVIGEIAALTPGPYIHIGGDESHVTALKDYVPFINRVQDIVTKHGKKVIGWDEIALAKLIPNTVVQYWARAENAKAGIAQGAKVIMSPATKAYLDMQYDSTTHLGLHWAAYVEIDSAYIWDVASIEKGIGQENIVGIEAPLWTETVTTMDDIEYLVFPRLPGHAEIGWSPVGKRNWEEYKVRLAAQKERFELLEIDYYASKLVPWEEEPSPKEQFRD